MSTSSASGVQEFPEDSLEKRVYAIAEKYAENIPVLNDRNRLGFTMFKHVQGEGDSPLVFIKSIKLSLTGITEAELAEKLEIDLKEFK